VAGRHGAAIHNLATGRWKLFGDRTQEKRIKTVGLCWFNDIAIIVSYDSTTERHELLFYPRNHLDDSSLLHTAVMPARRVPKFIDCDASFLVIFTADSFFYQYKVLHDPKSKLQTSHVHVKER
jgi:hypothetical protein